MMKTMTAKLQYSIMFIISPTQENEKAASKVGLIFFIFPIRSPSITRDHLSFLTYTWLDLSLQECQILHRGLRLWLAFLRRLSLPWCAI